MTDRELLELAAKAAGVEYGWQHIFDDYEGSTSEKWDWNPLEDDGDALRLAVKLYITVSNSEAGKHSGASSGKVSGISLNAHKGKPYHATRRAIVRAAAEIGKAMP